MNYVKLAKGFGNLFGRYLSPYLKKQGAKQLAYKEINDAVDVEDFVQKYIIGIEDANGPEIELDKEFERRMILESENIAEEIMDKDVSDWSVDDFNFIRGTIGYHKNWERRRKVLDFLNYNRVER